MVATTITLTPVAVAAGVAAGGSAPSRPVALAHPPKTAETRALAVLRAWDHRRATAWSHADPAALGRLYAPGSRTGAGDVQDLRRWRSRALRVVGLRQQVAALHVSAETSRHLVVSVTDRTVDGVAVGRHRRTALPVSAWTRHRVHLRRARGDWLVVEVVGPESREISAGRPAPTR